MITEFSIKNHRAIGANVALQLTHGPRGDIPAGVPSAVAGVWGPNGAGKTSLVDALKIVREAATGGRAWWLGHIPVEPHQGTDDDHGKSTTIKVRFDVPGATYRFTLQLRADAVERETLTVESKNTSKHQVFKRRGDKLTYQVAGSPKPTTENIRDAALAKVTMLPSRWLQSNPHAHAVKEMLDRVHIVPTTRNNHKDIELTLEICEAEGYGDVALKRRLAGALLANAGITTGNLQHGGSRAAREALERAGSGTRNILAIAGHAATVLVDGGMLVVDPLDAGIHSLWCQQLIDTFLRQPTEYGRRGQLLFTSNSKTGMSAVLPDQVWLIEKQLEKSQTYLYSLDDFNDIWKPTTNIANGYEAGRYGGIPEHTPLKLQQIRLDVYKRARERGSMEQAAATQ